jgi:AraC family transcriptional regulator of adaptative response/methylated-DNA-[protein]-cysteine methyltransferase
LFLRRELDLFLSADLSDSERKIREVVRVDLRHHEGMSGALKEDLSGDRAAMWRAVLARDARHDGSFVYGVRSTGVYCRPSCPSRRPLAKNAVFFATTGEAERAGYRACRRCRPAELAATGARATADAVRAYIDAHLGERITLEGMSRALGLSPFHLQRTFKRLTGVSPKRYASARRAERFKELLKSGSRVTEAVYDAGFVAPSRAYDASRAHFGMTPLAYARGGAGLRIRYAIAKSSLGFVLVAATDRGLCRVAMSGSRESLRKALAEEYPRATLEESDVELAPRVAEVLRHVEGRARADSLPLDVRATAFQRRVWDALREIPYGETRTYSDIARSIGAPRAARAVGSACGQNPVALVIPCHRAVREDGGLGGYAWGLDVKRRLLEIERGTRSR